MEVIFFIQLDFNFR